MVTCGGDDGDGGVDGAADEEEVEEVAAAVDWSEEVATLLQTEGTLGAAAAAAAAAQWAERAAARACGGLTAGAPAGATADAACGDADGACGTEEASAAKRRRRESTRACGTPGCVLPFCHLGPCVTERRERHRHSPRRADSPRQLRARGSARG